MDNTESFGQRAFRLTARLTEAGLLSRFAYGRLLALTARDGWVHVTDDDDVDALVDTEAPFVTT